MVKTELKSMFELINRGVFTVRGKEAFFEWVKKMDCREGLETFGGQDKSYHAYLVEEEDCYDEVKERKMLTKHWKAIAAAEFEGWWTEIDDWPVLKNVADFEHYFEWSYADMVFDTSSAGLEKD